MDCKSGKGKENIITTNYKFITNIQILMFYLFIFLSTFFLSLIFSYCVRAVALRAKIIDYPERAERKVHKTPTPLLGGVAVFLAFFIVLGLLAVLTDKLWIGHIASKQLVAVFLGALVLMIGGYFDDKYNLPPVWQTIAPSLAAAIIVLGGITITFITNPFGGTIDLATYTRHFALSGVAGPILQYNLRLPADLITFAWLSGMMYTTKLLDGLDGLVSSLTGVGALVIFAFTLFTKYYQPDVALLSIILAGACFGFLLLNRHPARLFLGEGGSLLLGFLLGVLAIISGGKIATTLLVVGVPFFDMIWVILRRLFWEHRSVTTADDKHMHFRLLKLGLSQNQVVILMNIIPATFGAVGLYLQSKTKLFLLGFLLIFMAFLGLLTIFIYKHRHGKNRI